MNGFPLAWWQHAIIWAGWLVCGIIIGVLLERVRRTRR